MIKAMSFALVMAAGVGAVNVPHVMFYENPGLLFARYARQGYEHSG